MYIGRYIMGEFKQIIKVLTKLFKIIIGFICIAEEKIKYYHAQKKLRYIILINIILVFMIDIVEPRVQVIYNVQNI